jgi:hypothetical protein
MVDGASKPHLAAFCRALLRPIARLLLKSGVTWKQFADMAKAVFVEVATDEFGIRGRPTNISRVSILTGIGRREVRKQRAALEQVTTATPTYLNSATRVLAGWHQDRDYLGANDVPRELIPFGPPPSFEELCRRYGGDLPVGALLKELRAVGAIEDIAGGRLKVLQRAYIPLQVDPEKTLRAGSVYEDFGNTVVHDLTGGPDEPLRFERRATNALIDARRLPEFRELLERHGQSFLEYVDAWLTSHAVPEDEASTRRTVRLGVGVYHIQDDPPRIVRR